MRTARLHSAAATGQVQVLDRRKPSDNAMRLAAGDFMRTLKGARSRRSGSAFDDIDRQSSSRGLLVLALHVEAGFAHRLDDLVE